jgi:hypothetical protein
MRSVRSRLGRVTLAGAVISVTPLALAAPARAAVPQYTCPTPTVYPAGGGNVHPSNLTVADFNGDHVPDVAVAINGAGVSVYLNDGSGHLGSPTNYPAIGNEGALFVVAADFNGDNKIDLASSTAFSKNVSLFLNNGDGTFAVAVPVRAGAPSQGLAAADFNGDGHVDLASLNGNIQLLLNNGNGTFKQPRTIRAPGSAYAFVVGDFNNDGRPDLATADPNNDNNVAVLINRGDGVFSNARYYALGTEPFGIATGDFNNDGYLDLVTANVNKNTFSVLFNRADGTGTFRAAQSFPGSGGQFGVATADVNGDGLPDIIGANPFGDNIMVLLNKDGHTFLPAVSCDVGPGRLMPAHVAAADLNGDGTVDLVTVNGRDSISVLLSGG